jgi:trans-aconitate methyltransferase
MDLIESAGGVEHRHPWERARLYAIERLVGRTALTSPRVLDVGCGDGFAIRGLRARIPFSRTVGLDVHLTDSSCADLSSPEVEFVSELAVSPENRFELLLLLDVLEHVEEPVAFLGEMVRERLVPGGTAILTAPAFQSLFSHHDRELRHFRRYARKQLTQEAEQAGLTVAAAGYFFVSLLLPRALSVVMERLGSRATGRVEDGAVGVGGWNHGACVSRALTVGLRADARLCLAAERAGFCIPGLSAWAICRKPSS